MFLARNTLALKKIVYRFEYLYEYLYTVTLDCLLCTVQVLFREFSI